MFGLLSKRLLLVHPNRRWAPIQHLGFLQFDDTSIHIVRSFSSSLKKKSSEAQKDKHQQQRRRQSFTVSYLTNSCGLSLESAKATAEKINFKLKTPDNADSVLALLRNHGFSKTHISNLVRIRPTLLFASPEKTLLPKFEFFYSVGISSADLPMIISKNPSILMRSLVKCLIPTYNFLKSVVPDERVAVVFRRCLRYFFHGVENKIATKVASLREVGVPQSRISFFITSHSTAATRSSEKFPESVDKVVKLGFSPSKTTFVVAVQVIFQMTKSNWEHKMEVYRRWGWSEDDVWMAFKVHPICMNLSEKKIGSTMDYFVNKMSWQPTAIARNPTILFYNLEKRIIPRCSVIKALVLKGLIKKDTNLVTFLSISEKHFLKKFVTKYQEKVPQLLNVYERKLGLLELGFGSEEICGMKQVDAAS